MAKQTFTTGQVLTAAQMTSLQQTAMGGGSATAKTASYVLVAADAGTTVAMNAAGATTITVNTGLFAAGDTVFIQNLGAGACTVTAGTATVATAGSLILPQNDAGILYFTATGASIFYDFIQAGAVSPLTTKGDLYTFSTSDARLGVGANATILTADSAEATGMKWATPSAAGANFSLLNSGGTALTGATTVTISGISGQGTIYVLLRDASAANSNANITVRINGVTTSTYEQVGVKLAGEAAWASSNIGRYGLTDDKIYVGTLSGSATSSVGGYVRIEGASTAGTKMFTVAGSGNTGSNSGQQSFIGGGYLATTAVTSVSVFSDNGNLDAGTVYVYASA